VLAAEIRRTLGARFGAPPPRLVEGPAIHEVGRTRLAPRSAPPSKRRFFRRSRSSNARARPASTPGFNDSRSPLRTVSPACVAKRFDAAERSTLDASDSLCWGVANVLSGASGAPEGSPRDATTGGTSSARSIASATTSAAAWASASQLEASNRRSPISPPCSIRMRATQGGPAVTNPCTREPACASPARAIARIASLTESSDGHPAGASHSNARARVRARGLAFMDPRSRWERASRSVRDHRRWSR